MRVHLDEHQETRLSAVGIRIAGHGIVDLNPETVLEGDNWLLGGLDNRVAARIGAFSYSNSTISPYVWAIGRYCSLASASNFGDVEHPVDWASTSSFVYDPGFLWGEHLTRRGKQYQTTNLPFEPKRGGITIGNDVWIGARAYVKAGVTLGDGCIIGTGAVVTRNVPPYAIVAGNPGRIIRYRIAPELVPRLRATSWWDYDFADLDGLDVADVERFIAGIEDRKARGEIKPHIGITQPLATLIQGTE